MSKLDVISVLKADGTTTLTLTPVSKIGNEIAFRDLGNASVNLREQLNISFRKGNSARGVKDKTTEQVVLPYEMADSQTGLTSTDYATLSIVFNIPQTAPLAVRKELIARHSVAMNAQLVDLVENSAVMY